MSPKKRQIAVDFLSVVLPDAPIHTRTGNTIAIHIISNTPLRHTGDFPSIYGTQKIAISTTVQIQKAPLMLKLRKFLEISIPRVKGNSILSIPPQKFRPESIPHLSSRSPLHRTRRTMKVQVREERPTLSKPYFQDDE